MIFKVAILQIRAEISNINKNVDTIIGFMKEASQNGTDILLLPECFVTGYELPMTYENSISCDDEVIMKICEVAKAYDIGVVLTSFTKGKTQPQNTAFVIDKSGEILMTYSKVHTCNFADEKDIEAGTECSHMINGDVHEAMIVGTEFATETLSHYGGSRQGCLP